DGQITARITSLTFPDPWTKTGVMIRSSLDPSSRHAMLVMSGANGVAFQYRVTDGASMVSQTGSATVPPRWLRLVRQGSQLSGYESADGNTWTLVGQVSISMSTTVFIGFAITSHSTYNLATATFGNVSVTAANSSPTATPTRAATNTPLPGPTNTPGAPT